MVNNDLLNRFNLFNVDFGNNICGWIHDNNVIIFSEFDISTDSKYSEQLYTLILCSRFYVLDSMF